MCGEVGQSLPLAWLLVNLWCRAEELASLTQPTCSLGRSSTPALEHPSPHLGLWIPGKWYSLILPWGLKVPINCVTIPGPYSGVF